MEQWYSPLIIFIIGAVAGTINIMAGGGTILTVGVMMLLGMEGSTANGTNRISLLMGAISGASAYRSEKFGNLRQSITFGLIAAPGALIGAFYAVKINDKLFQQLLALVMIFILITLFLPKKEDSSKEISPARKIAAYPIIFCLGLYGGFIQAGVGFMLMATFRHLLGFSLLKTNMNKTWTILVYTIPVLIVFGITKNINWFYAIVLSAGNMVGSWFAVKLALKKGDKSVKIVLSVAIVLMASKFLFTH